MNLKKPEVQRYSNLSTNLHKGKKIYDYIRFVYSKITYLKHFYQIIARANQACPSHNVFYDTISKNTIILQVITITQNPLLPHSKCTILILHKAIAFRNKLSISQVLNYQESFNSSKLKLLFFQMLRAFIFWCSVKINAIVFTESPHEETKLINDLFIHKKTRTFLSVSPLLRVSIVHTKNSSELLDILQNVSYSSKKLQGSGTNTRTPTPALVNISHPDTERKRIHSVSQHSAFSRANRTVTYLGAL